jgi:oligopeptide/dipeptide ABC transporter ATP-binding protein
MEPTATASIGPKTQAPLLSVKNLSTCFRTDDGIVRAVDGVSFEIAQGEAFALVGESGCGKSVTAHSIMRIIPSPPGRIVGGAVRLDGTELTALPERKMREIRGSSIAMIFQEPMTSLNPVFTCGYQIVEAIRLHRNMGGTEAKNLAVGLLGKVGIPEPALRFDEYPHQLSGGMRQRVMIAMALSCRPKLLIADEPTTALDVTIQAQILELLTQLQRTENMSIMLITHDLSVVAETADTVAVMYASKIAEKAGVKTLFARPMHPYTRGLFRSIPRLGQKKERLDTIAGNVPNPLRFPSGCKFHPRCELSCERAKTDSNAVEILTEGGKRRVLRNCAEKEPPLQQIGPGHWCACWEAGREGGTHGAA